MPLSSRRTVALIIPRSFDAANVMLSICDVELLRSVPNLEMKSSLDRMSGPRYRRYHSTDWLYWRTAAAVFFSDWLNCCVIVSWFLLMRRLVDITAGFSALAEYSHSGDFEEQLHRRGVAEYFGPKFFHVFFFQFPLDLLRHILEEISRPAPDETLTVLGGYSVAKTLERSTNLDSRSIRDRNKVL